MTKNIRSSVIRQYMYNKANKYQQTSDTPGKKYILSLIFAVFPNKNQTY